jgi:hypothetical protein
LGAGISINAPMIQDDFLKKETGNWIDFRTYFSSIPAFSRAPEKAPFNQRK